MKRSASETWARTIVYLLAFSAGLFAQTEKFSATPEYQSIQAALSEKDMKPSRLGSGEMLKTSRPTVPVTATDGPETLKLETSLWRVEIDKASAGLAVTNKQAGITWRTASSDSARPGISWATDAEATTSRTFPLVRIQQAQRQGNRWMMIGSVRGSDEPSNIEIAVITPTVIRVVIGAPKLTDKAALILNISGAGPFFGLGEKFGHVKLDGQKIVLRPNDKLGTPGHDWTYIPTPFLFTPRGLGLYLDTAAQSAFDFTHASGGQFAAQLRAPTVDCYFFIGDPKQVLGDYTSLTGRVPLPPPWALGVWINSMRGSEPVLQDAERLRHRGIPASAIWNLDMMDDQANLGFSLWPTSYYGRPGAFSAKLHQLGFKSLTYVHPYVRAAILPFNSPSVAFQEGLSNHYFVLGANGQPLGVPFEPVPTGNVDFTNPAAVDWWERMLRRAVTEFGFDGWMEDFGEQIEDDNRFAANMTGRELTNVYPLLYHKVSHAIATKLKPDIVAFSRSGYAGSQGFSRVIWGGDQLPDWSADRGYPSAVSAGITAGLSGFGIWAPDILSSGTSKELWIRWTEFGALTPVMRDHLWDKPNFAVDLWFDDQTTDIFRRYARLHTSLFPYLYTYAHQATETGLPIIRHPIFAYPEDSRVYDSDYEYLLGDKLLVAPVVTEGSRTRSLYLPAGEWVDYWTGATVAGGRMVEVPAPLEHIPILVSAGSIIPMVDADIETLATDLANGKYRTLDNSLRWRVFPATGAAHATFVNYDGTSATADQKPAQFRVKVEHSPVMRSYEVILPSNAPPRQVNVDGRFLIRLDDSGYRARKQGWWMDSTEGTLHVLFVADDFLLNVARS